jgi:hydroxypyruvate reductase 1
MQKLQWRVHNPSGKHRVIVTRLLPGQRWLEILIRADCRVEIGTAAAVLSQDEIKAAIGGRCDAAIGQVTEKWGEELFISLKQAGGAAYSNYAVGHDNVDIAAATRNGIAVGNTPGVLTETTAEMAVALTFAAARRIGEAERFLRAGKFSGWQPTLLLGKLLHRKTVGIVGAGRIGSAYARMMMEGHRMNVIYHDPSPNAELEACAQAYNRYLDLQRQRPVLCHRAENLEALLKAADCVSLHTILNSETRHMIDADRLRLMKPDALLINTSRGPVIDEAALVEHCRRHPEFRAGLDVFEDEPNLKAGLAALDNVVIVPHIASATAWARQGMAALAACNVAALIKGHPVWNRPDILAFAKGDDPPAAAPSVVNAEALGLHSYRH